MEGIFGRFATPHLFKRAAGVRFSFSRLRPREDPIESTHGVRPARSRFMRLYNFATEVTKLGGNDRREHGHPSR